MTDRVCDDDNMENKTLVEGVYKPTVTKKNGTQELVFCDDSSNSASWFLHWAALTADVPLFAAGIGMSWTSPVIPKFHGEENPFDHEVTTTQEAWIAALTPLGSAIGPLAAGYCADKLGRKKALLCLATPMVAGFFILAWARQIWLYYLARFLVGLGAGSAFAVVPMYVSEISQPHNRGKYGSLMGVLITLGILYPFSIGPPLSIAVYSITCALPLILFLIIFAAFMPESPYYLMAMKEHDKAHFALRKLRSRGTDIRMELKEMKEGVEAEKKSTAEVMTLFTSTAGRQAFTIALGLVILQSFSGINPLISFLEPIYSAAGSTISPNVATIITGSVQVLSNIACVFMVEKMGKKLLILISCVFCFISMIILGIYFHLKLNKYNVEPIFWLPIACMLLYMLVFSFGLGPLPMIIIGEILPLQVKGIASALASTISFLSASLVTFLFPVVSEMLGMAGSFWLFAFFCLVCWIFVHFCVFETEGKSLAEIQRILQRSYT